MKTFTYSEARQRLGAVLDEACREGGVRIRRQDGSTFIVQPLGSPTSPLDVPGVKTNFRPGELVKMLAEERRRAADRILNNLSSMRPKARKKTAASTDAPRSRRKSRRTQ